MKGDMSKSRGKGTWPDSLRRPPRGVCVKRCSCRMSTGGTFCSRSRRSARVRTVGTLISSSSSPSSSALGSSVPLLGAPVASFGSSLPSVSRSVSALAVRITPVAAASDTSLAPEAAGPEPRDTGTRCSIAASTGAWTAGEPAATSAPPAAPSAPTKEALDAGDGGDKSPCKMPLPVSVPDCRGTPASFSPRPSASESTLAEDDGRGTSRHMEPSPSMLLACALAECALPQSPSVSPSKDVVSVPSSTSARPAAADDTDDAAAAPGSCTDRVDRGTDAPGDKSRLGWGRATPTAGTRVASSDNPAADVPAAAPGIAPALAATVPPSSSPSDTLLPLHMLTAAESTPLLSAAPRPERARSTTPAEPAASAAAGSGAGGDDADPADGTIPRPGRDEGRGRSGGLAETAYARRRRRSAAAARRAAAVHASQPYALSPSRISD